ncbi:CU044_5270 family protein [Actinoplanes sp. DH11]|uniref:CU044_5270 family protein n=1 Tax=Actinoplanes sp. DH11 TaxID=2857011 RepID=UPI001E5A028E|nr:CU044_5270 family protein [Actinoplanes sp. DH11]
MDEITLVRELGAETPLPSPERLSRARTALLSEVAPRRKRRRLTVAGLAAAAVAAVTIPVVVLPAVQTAQTTPSTPATTPATAGTATRVPEMTAVAAFLDQAATVAAGDPETVPRDDQYLYYRTVGRIGTLHETWLSIDGEHDNRSRDQNGNYRISPGCRNNRTTADDGRTVVGCEPVRRYRPDMPTEPAAMAGWIRDYVRAEAGDAQAGDLGRYVGVLAYQFWMRPAQRAALYRAIGLLDGVRLVEGVTDVQGREGVGVAWAGPGDTAERVVWIFDPGTHRLVGTADWLIDRVAVVDTLREKG